MKPFAKLSLAALLCFALCTACNHPQNDIMGDWVVADSIPTVGFNIGHNGLAASIGHPDVQYLKWKLHDQTLLLSGKQYCEGCTDDITDTLHIIDMEPGKELTVQHGGQKTRYVRP